MDLIAAVFEEALSRCHDAAVAARDAEVAWDGFREFVATVCGLQVANRGFAEVLTRTTARTSRSSGSARRRTGRSRTSSPAKREGRLREDFSLEDFPILLMANAGVLRSVGDAAPEASKRLAHDPGVLGERVGTAAARAEPEDPHSRHGPPAPGR